MRFMKKDLLSPKEIIAREKNYSNPIEDVFLHVKLVAEDNQIKFADDLFNGI